MLNQQGLKFILTGREINDCTQAEALLENVQTQAVLANKGYDNDKILELIEQDLQATAVIPSQSQPHFPERL